MPNHADFTQQVVGKRELFAQSNNLLQFFILGRSLED